LSDPASMDSKYADYVEHPRYGKGPVYTALNPDRNDPGVHLHWRTGIHSDPVIDAMRETFGKELPLPPGHSGAISGTAVAADLSRQTRATFPVTHYYDEDRVCRDCGRRFIFFAQEQKYWYEELHFPLDADCVRCPECRKKTQDIARRRKRFEELCQKPDRSANEMVEMADCCLSLIEEGVLGPRQTERVRAIFNRLPDDQRESPGFEVLLSRLHSIEKGSASESA
jgi:hypothetical protein